MPRMAIDIKPDDDVLCTHELKPAIPPRKIAAMWLAGRTLSPIAQRLITISTEVAAERANAQRDRDRSLVA